MLNSITTQERIKTCLRTIKNRPESKKLMMGEYKLTKLEKIRERQGKKHRKLDRVSEFTVKLIKQCFYQVRPNCYQKLRCFTNSFLFIQSVDNYLSVMQTVSEERAFLANPFHYRRDVLHQTASDARLMALVENGRRKITPSLASNLRCLIAESLASNKNSKKLRSSNSILKPTQLVNERVEHVFHDETSKHQVWYGGKIVSRIKGFRIFDDITHGAIPLCWTLAVRESLYG